MAWPLAARAQQPTIPVIGFLHSGSRSAFAFAIAPFHDGLKETGYIEGIDAATLEVVEQLSAFDVLSNGYDLNVLGILRSQSALLVLDNVAVSDHDVMSCAWTGSSVD